MSAKPDKIDWDKPVHMTEAEYLEFEQNSEERHEFDDGVVRPLSRLIGMAGGTIRHSRAGSRLIRHIGNALESSSCEVFGPDQAVKARNDPRYSYPDVSIVCGEIEGDPVNPSLFINNPICIIEVLSPGTQQYDRTAKFDKYARIESLREYVLIEHDQPAAQTLYREDDGRWTFANFHGREQIVPLRSVEIEVRLTDIFPADGDEAE